MRPYGANFWTPADLNLTPRSRLIGCVVSAAYIFSGFSGFRFFRFCSSGSVSPVRFCFIVRFGSPGSVHAGTAAGSISRGPVRFWESPVRLEVSCLYGFFPFLNPSKLIENSGDFPLLGVALGVLTYFCKERCNAARYSPEPAVPRRGFLK